MAVSREIGFLRLIPILILVGPGNNGLDGLIAGTHLSSFGAKVTAVLLSERIPTDTIMTKADQSGVRILTLSSRNGDESLDLLGDEIKKSIVIVDAIFGIGINRPIEGYLSKVLATVNKKKRKDSLIFAVDSPTGLFIDSGGIDKSFLAPDITLALGFLKIGHVTQPGASKIGRLQLLDIGIPTDIESSVRTNLITKEIVSKYLIDRPNDSNKGTFGKAFIIGGSKN